MKNLKFIGFLIVIASSLFFIQCTTDTIVGLDGVDGINGVDGVDGVDGTDGTASCVACHSNSHREPVYNSFNESLHFNQTTMYDGSSLVEYTNQSFFFGSCTPCHSNEGYISTLEGNPPTAALAVATGISCNTCHDKHGTFDFENDGQDYALRNINPVSLFIDESTVIDFGGSSNNCITCHQPRSSYEIPGPTADYTITSMRFGPHHGPQSTFLEGIMGANVAGSEDYPGVGTAAHRTGASCVQCHMSGDDGSGNGQHTFLKTDNGCAGCHSSGIPNEVTGFTADLTTLKNLLLAGNYINESGYVIGGDGINTASSSNPITVPAKVAQAIWNYKTLKEDNSKGVHNPNYAKALLKNSIEALQP